MNDNLERKDKHIAYQIKIQGHLEKKWEAWLNGMNVQTSNTDRSQPQTSMIANVPDQAALRGIITKLWDLNLTLISVLMLD